MTQPPDISPRDNIVDDQNTDRRDPVGGRGDTRRREGWRDFRRAYPGFIFTMLIAVVAMVAVDALIVTKRRAYTAEVARLRSSMSEQERAKTDAIVAAEENKTRITLELARRQAKLERALHLAISIDSGTMTLEREGAVLRDMPVAFGPETKVGADSIPVVIPRGETSIVKATEEGITLDGGTTIYPSDATALAQDAAPIPPGAVRVRRSDLKAILPDLNVGMRVFFY
jgi:hypothetical protein